MDFPTHQWVYVTVRNTRILGFAYVDSMAGPSIKGRGVRDPITPAQVERAAHDPNETVRAGGFPMEILTADEVRRLGLPAVPEWYTRFYANQ